MFVTIADLPADVKDAIPEEAREIFRKAFNQGTAAENSLNRWTDGYLAVEKAGYVIEDGRFVKSEGAEPTFAIPVKVAAAVDDEGGDPLIQKIATAQPITKDEVLKLAGIFDGNDQAQITAHGGDRGRKWIGRLLRKLVSTKGGGPVVLPPPPEDHAAVTLRGQISKIDTDRRLVFGWFNVASENGVPVVDLQKDTITEDELEKTAYDVVRNGIKAGFSGGEMHTALGVGELVESMVFTKAKQDKLGIDLGQVGWWGGFHISDDETWAKVKSGEYAGFSISGTGRRSATTDTAA